MKVRDDRVRKWRIKGRKTNGKIEQIENRLALKSSTRIAKSGIKQVPTVCFTDLGKLNLLMVVRF